MLIIAMMSILVKGIAMIFARGQFCKTRIPVWLGLSPLSWHLNWKKQFGSFETCWTLAREPRQGDLCDNGPTPATPPSKVPLVGVDKSCWTRLFKENNCWPDPKIECCRDWWLRASGFWGCRGFPASGIQGQGTGNRRRVCALRAVFRFGHSGLPASAW